MDLETGFMDIAKDLLSFGKVEEAENVLTAVLRRSHSNEAQKLLDKIQTKKIKINPSKSDPDPTETERQKKLEIAARNLHLKTGKVKEENVGVTSKGAESLIQPNRGYFSNQSNQDSVNVHSVAEARSVNEATNAFASGLLDGDNKTPLNVLKAEPVRSDNDKKVNTALAGPTMVTTQHENVCTPNKTPNSHESVPKPMADVSKNNERKNTEAPTTKKITANPDHKLSEARNVKNNNCPILINKNLAQNNESKNEDSEKDAAKLMNIARDYLKKGNLVEAERYLMKALEIQPCATAAKILRQVQALTGYNCYARYVNPEAENCFKDAKLAFSSQNLDKAEQLLLKAEELCPQQRQKALLADVRLAKVAEKNKRESMLLPSPSTDPQLNDRFPHFPEIQNFTFNFTFTELAGSSALQKPNELKKSGNTAGIPTRANRNEGTGHLNAPTPTTGVNVNKEEAANCSKKAEDTPTQKNKPEQIPLKTETLSSLSDNRDSTTNNEITKTDDSLKIGDHIAVSKDKKSMESGYQCRRKACVYTMNAQDVADFEAAEQSLRKAEMALDNGELEKAKRCAARAQRMRPSERGAELLRRVDDAKQRITNDHDRLDLRNFEHRETINNDKSSYSEPPSDKPEKDSDTALEDNHRLAEKIIKLAKTSIDDGNYERAKQMLEKAEQLFPTTAAKDLLQEIEEIKAKKRASDSLLGKVNNLLLFAKKAEVKGDLHMSQKYLEKAQEIFPEHEEVNEKLLKIRSAKTKDTGTEEPAKPVATTYVSDTSIILEETYAKARAAMAQGRYGAAENMILDLKENIPDVNVDGILSEIRAARASRSSSEGTVTGGKGTYAQMCGKSKQTYDNYFKTAENAIKEGDLFKAQDYLLLASKFNSGEPVKSLLNHVQERMSSGGNKTQQEETINETKKAEAQKHIENAHKAFTDGCLDKTEQLLLEALELQPDEETEKLLNNVKAAKVAVSNPTSRLRSGYAWRDHSSATNQQSSVMHEEPIITDPGMNPENRESSQKTGPTKTLEEGSNTKQNMSASNQSYKNESTPEYSSTYRVNVLSVNKFQAQAYIDMAKQAFSNKNYDQAEELVLKSQELIPSVEATELLKEIRLAKRLAVVKENDTEMNVNHDKKINTHVPPSNNFETIDDLRRKDAETSTKKAQIALSEGDLEKAERLLLKAERIFPTEQAKTLLEDVSLKKKTRNVKENKDKSLTSPVSDDVDNLIKIAFEHIDKKDFHTAESFLYIANKLSPSDAHADWLQQVRNAIKHQEVYSMPVKKEKKREEEAEKYVYIAKEALRVNDIVKAEGNLVVASSLHPSKTADELLKKVRDASKKRYMLTPTNSNSAPVEDLNDFKSDEYIRMAKNAIDIENYVLAEHYLSKAQMLLPSVHADYLLGSIRAKKMLKNHQSKQSWWP